MVELTSRVRPRSSSLSFVPQEQGRISREREERSTKQSDGDRWRSSAGWGSSAAIP